MAVGVGYSRTVLRICLLALIPVGLAAQGVSYHNQVRPLLEQRCGACHYGERSAAGVALTSFAGVKAVSARLVPAVSGASPRMPKSGAPLTAAEVSLLERWIAGGALD